MIKKLTALLLAVLMLPSMMLTSCKSKKETTTSQTAAETTDSMSDAEKEKLYSTVLLTIGDYDITYEMYRYFFLNNKNSYDNGDNTYWNKNPNALAEMKENILKSLKYQCAMYTLADKYGLKVTDDDNEAIDKQIKANDSQYMLYGLTFEQYCESQYMTLDIYKELTALYSYLQQYIYDYYKKEANGLVDYANTDAIDKSGEGYVRVKHILVGYKTNSGTASSDTTDYAAQAQSLLDQLKACTTKDELYTLFDKLVAEKSEDEGMDAKNGYYITKDSDMVPEFLDAALKLKVGELSEVVKSDYGYHIIIRLDTEFDYIKNNIYPSSSFNNYLTSFMDTLKVTTTPLYDSLTITSIK